MEIPYIEEYTELGLIYTPLNPTGKWKISTGPKYKNIMHIQHKGFIFKSWIDEGRIKFLEKRTTAIFSCK